MGFDVLAPGVISNPTFAKVNLVTGSAGSVGTATLSSGTVTVSTTAVTASSIILVTPNTPAGATQGVKYKVPVGSIVAGTSFVITAIDNTGTTVNWEIIN